MSLLMYIVRTQTAIDEPWLNMEPIIIGHRPATHPAADLYALVEKSGEPYLRLDLYLEYGLGTFSEFRIWKGYLLMGYAEDFHAVHLGTHEITHMEMSFYFGSFAAPADFGRQYDEDFLLIASGTDLHKLSPDLDTGKSRPAIPMHPLSRPRSADE